MVNLPEFGDTVFTPLEYSEYIVMTRSKKATKTALELKFLQDALMPKVAEPWRLVDRMGHIFLSKFNSHIHNESFPTLREIMTSCTFNMKENCLSETKFEKKTELGDCMIFNYFGTEKITSAISSLDMVLFTNDSDYKTSTTGTKAFAVSIHEPYKVYTIFNQCKYA